MVSIDTTTTVSPTITIHGGGATLRSVDNNDGATVVIGAVASVLHDLRFITNGSAGGSVHTGTAPCTLYRIKLDTAGAIEVGSNLIVHDAEIIPHFDGVQLNSVSHLSMDRVSIHGGTHGIRSTVAGATIALTNVLVFDTASTAVDLTGAIGSVGFTTVADSANLGSALICSTDISLQSNIIWTPGATAPIQGSCSAITSTIAGPVSTPGTMNVDPQFADEIHRNYHLAAGSTAIDIVDTGPATDVEGTARPQGVRFDLGAYEAK